MEQDYSAVKGVVADIAADGLRVPVFPVKGVNAPEDYVLLHGTHNRAVYRAVGRSYRRRLNADYVFDRGVCLADFRSERIGGKRC